MSKEGALNAVPLPRARPHEPDCDKGTDSHQRNIQLGLAVMDSDTATSTQSRITISKSHLPLEQISWIPDFVPS